MPGRELHVRLDLLDRQLLDRDGEGCGNVDDVEITIDDDGTPWVTALLTGPGVLAYRVGRRRLGRWLQRTNQLVHGDEQGVRSRVPVELAYEIGAAVRVAASADDLASHDGERWVRRHIIEKIPGGRHAPAGE